MNLIAFLFVFGTFAATVGILLSMTAFDKGTWGHRLSLWLSIAGVLSLAGGLLMFLSGELGTNDANTCEDLGGVYVLNRCLDVSEIPTLPLSRE